jgi:hypothetical protein
VVHWKGSFDGLVIGAAFALIEIAYFVDCACPDPLGWTRTPQLVHDFTEKYAGRGASEQGRRCFLLTPLLLTPHFLQPQPADAALIGIARLAGAGKIAMHFVAMDVGPAVAETREIFHAVTVTLIVPLQNPHSDPGAWIVMLLNVKFTLEQLELPARALKVLLLHVTINSKASSDGLHTKDKKALAVPQIVVVLDCQMLSPW